MALVESRADVNGKDNEGYVVGLRRGPVEYLRSRC